ncbi:hypothetical protein G9A89_015297 [Geosiphon pyriformis]|nr:hypothetical protein G9A89_015297 [Geosiphon pyriformis]
MPLPATTLLPCRFFEQFQGFTSDPPPKSRLLDLKKDPVCTRSNTIRLKTFNENVVINSLHFLDSFDHTSLIYVLLLSGNKRIRNDSKVRPPGDWHGTRGSVSLNTTFQNPDDNESSIMKLAPIKIPFLENN